jgi:hypothetical protein
MIEHFLILRLVDTLLELDRFFQRGVRSGVPGIEQLLQDPQGLLMWEEIVIRPRRSYAVATVLGSLVGCLCPCGFLFYNLDQPGHQFGGPAPWHTQVLLLTTVLLGPLTMIVLLSHWLRGGEMVLRVNGVVLRYRKDRVFCPWALFQAPGEPWKRSAERLVLPVWPTAVPGVVHSRGDAVVATGRDVHTRQLYFRPDGQAVMRDLYCVRLGDLAGLLVRLGALLGRTHPAVSPPICGDPVPEGMS